MPLWFLEAAYSTPGYTVSVYLQGDTIGFQLQMRLRLGKGLKEILAVVKAQLVLCGLGDPMELEVSDEGNIPGAVSASPHGRITVQASGVIEQGHPLCSGNTDLLNDNSWCVIGPVNMEHLTLRHQVTAHPELPIM